MKPLKVIYYLLIACLTVVALLLIFSVFPIPGNYKLMVVQSGSMEPAIKLGSIVVVKPADEYQVDEIITFESPGAPGKPTTHRIVEIKTIDNRQSYITKGDANKDPDKEEIAKRDIVGKVLFAIPYLGYAVDTVRKPFGFMLLIVLPAALIIYDEIRKIKDEVVKMRRKKTLLLLFMVSASLLSLSFTNAYFSDTETSTGNILQATTWGVWTQTSQGDFEAGNLSDIDTTTSPGEAMLTGAYPVAGDTVALWHMNEGSGSITYDETGNNNDGTLKGDTKWVPGKYSQALEFDGNGDYIEVSDSASLDISGNITIEAWVRADTWDNPTAPYNVRNIVDKGEHKTSKAYSLHSYDNKLHFRINKSGSCDVSGDLPVTGEWHHVAGTYDGTTMKIYVDNTEKGSTSCSITINTNDEPLYIGGAVDRTYWFDGVIDEVRISNTAKTSFPIDYFSPGTLESQVFNGGEMRDWNLLKWKADLPASTEIKLKVATSDVGSDDNGPDWTWWPSSFNSSPVDLESLPLPSSRYIKWKATLTGTDSNTPTLEEVSIRHYSP